MDRGERMSKLESIQKKIEELKLYKKYLLTLKTFESLNGVNVKIQNNR